jgi:hypothetical protein
MLCLVALAGCATEGPQVNEYLDRDTAVTIRAVGVPYVYEHEVPEMGVNVRDYLSIGAVEVNNMGARKHYLAVVSWSTVDRSWVGAPAAPKPEALTLALAGRPRELTLATHDRRSLGIGIAPITAPIGYAGESWYGVALGDLRAFAATPPESIDIEVDGRRASYTLWERGDAAFAEFLRDTPDQIESQPRH